MKKNLPPIVMFCLALYALFLAISALLAPYLKATSMVGISSVFYSLLNTHCHQIPGRTLWVFGHPMGLCSRCFSSYLAFGVFTLILFSIRGSSKHWKLGLLLTIPLFLDGLTQVFGLRTSTNFLRISTGLLAGIGLALTTRKAIAVLNGFLALLWEN